MLTIDPAILKHPKFERELCILMVWPDAVSPKPANHPAPRKLPPAGFSPDLRPYQTSQAVSAGMFGSSCITNLEMLWTLGLIERGMRFDTEFWSLVAGSGNLYALTEAGRIVRGKLLEDESAKKATLGTLAKLKAEHEAGVKGINNARGVPASNQANLRIHPATDSKAVASVSAAVQRNDAKADRPEDGRVGNVDAGTDSDSTGTAGGDVGRWAGSGAGSGWAGDDSSRSINDGAGKQQNGPGKQEILPNSSQVATRNPSLSGRKA